MKHFATRVWMVAALVAFGWLTTAWVRSGYSFDVHPLRQGLEDLPMELSGYQGSDITVTSRVTEILDADSSINRHYERSDRKAVTLFMSAWVRPESIADAAPHRPEVCYTSAGWKLLGGKTVKANTPKGTLPLKVLLFEKGGDRCVVAYWYQMGRTIFSTKSQARSIHRSLWGKREWPATVKVMVQTPAQEIDPALPQIEQFASAVYEWSADL